MPIPWWTTLWVAPIDCLGASSVTKHIFLSFVEEDLALVRLFRGQAKIKKGAPEFDDYSVKVPYNSMNATYIPSQISEDPCRLLNDRSNWRLHIQERMGRVGDRKERGARQQGDRRSVEGGCDDSRSSYDCASSGDWMGY